jgi:hypothetical protein
MASASDSDGRQTPNAGFDAPGDNAHGGLSDMDMDGQNDTANKSARSSSDGGIEWRPYDHAVMNTNAAAGPQFGPGENGFREASPYPGMTASTSSPSFTIMSNAYRTDNGCSVVDPQLPGTHLDGNMYGGSYAPSYYTSFQTSGGCASNQFPPNMPIHGYMSGNAGVGLTSDRTVQHGANIKQESFWMSSSPQQGLENPITV